MFEGFEERRVETPEAEIYLRMAGSGPAVLLIHGYPQNHACWFDVAPQLTDRFTVVVPDLRGYGASSKPADDDGHNTYSKRAMAADLAFVMTALGFETFQVVGHDRGARVGYRMCLDFPGRVTRFCSLDVVPTLHMWDSIDKKRAVGAFHWSFLAQPAPFPETFIAFDPDGFHSYLMGNWAAPGFEFDTAAKEACLAPLRESGAIAATCADYRAGASTDAEHDAADKAAGRKVQCPMLFLWGGARGFGGPQGGNDPLNVWREWCAGEVTGGPVDCGHFLPEEKPDEIAARLLDFLDT
jgi:haloacetate dehalogenase